MVRDEKSSYAHDMKMWAGTPSGPGELQLFSNSRPFKTPPQGE